MHRGTSGLAAFMVKKIRRPAKGLIRRAYGSTFGEPEIEDIYANAWLGTLRALERKAADLTDNEVRSYLLTAVANHASKEIRRRRRKPVAPLEAAGAVAEVSDSLHERAEATEARRLTRDLLASLPPRRRAVMLLRYGWELEPGEICGMVKGLTPRALRKEITRGVDDLVERIKLVEEGRWCEDREPLLQAFASGTATEDHSDSGHSVTSPIAAAVIEFVGKLTGSPSRSRLDDSPPWRPGGCRRPFDPAREGAGRDRRGKGQRQPGALSRSETSDGHHRQSRAREVPAPR